MPVINYRSIIVIIFLYCNKTPKATSFAPMLKRAKISRLTTVVTLVIRKESCKMNLLDDKKFKIFYLF